MGFIFSSLRPSKRPAIGLPSPPFIHVDGLRNFRDCGLYPVTSSQSCSSTTTTTTTTNPSSTTNLMIRPGILYRASEPSKITPSGTSTITSLSISHIIDLRSLAEIDRDVSTGRGRGVTLIPGTQRIYAPVFQNTDYGPEEVAKRVKSYTSADGTEGFVKVYERMLESGSEAIKAEEKEDGVEVPFEYVLRHLAGEELPSPVLLHCTAGKDRTGVICAVVLSLCGVPDEIIAHEYSLTDLGLGERFDEFVDHILADPKTGLNGDREAAERMVSARKENMLATLEMLRRKYGSVEAFVKERCGLSEEQVARLRRNLTVQVGDGQQPLDWQAHAALVAKAVRAS